MVPVLIYCVVNLLYWCIYDVISVILLLLCYKHHKLTVTWRSLAKESLRIMPCFLKPQCLYEKSHILRSKTKENRKWGNWRYSDTEWSYYNDLFQICARWFKMTHIVKTIFKIWILKEHFTVFSLSSSIYIVSKGYSAYRNHLYSSLCGTTQACVGLCSRGTPL